MRNLAGLKFEPTVIPVEAAAAEVAALATPLVPVVPVLEGTAIVGIDGTEVETVGVRIVGTLTVGVEIVDTFGKNGIEL
jgi:hypothetical protein